MKKPLVIIVILLAAFTLFYLIHDDSKNPAGQKNGREQSLLSDTADNNTTETTTEYIDERNTEPGNDDEEKDIRENPVDTMTFSIEGEERSYYAFKQFTYVRVHQDLEGYIANFSANIDVIDIRNVKSYVHVLSILLPKEVTPGTYDQHFNPFIVQYFGSEPGTMYIKSPDYGFTFNVTEWGGPGGRAKGTFYGELKAATGPGSVTIENGNFDIAIK